MNIAIITGTRYATNAWAPTITRVLQLHNVGLVIHGAAYGVDAIADKVAWNLQVPVYRFPAQWKEHGKSAGPIRNEQMLRELQRLVAQGHTGMVLAFHHNIDASKSTRDMVGIAKRAGIPVHLYAHTL